jgi:hypothetical protein
MFKLLNLISGFLETGAVIFALKHYGIEGALLAALLYQAGNLVPSPIRLSRLPALSLSIASTMLMIVGVFYPLAIILAVPLLSAALQSIRAEMKAISKKMPKRILRTVGFMLGFSFLPILGTICSGIVMLCIIKAKIRSKTEINFPKFGTLHAVMILHQMHYFVYCYAVMIIAYQYGGALLATGLFFAGWITYVLAPLLYKSREDYKRMFFFGHSLLVAILLSMFLIQSLPLLALLWLLTGFGGTTEFCIGRFAKQHGNFNEDWHNCAENFGHVIGTAVCLAAFLITRNLYLSPLYAAIFAGAAIALMAFVRKVSI